MKIADLSRSAKVREFRQGRLQNLFLSPQVAGAAKSTTDRMIDKHGAWRRDFGHDVQNCADDERRDRMAFDDMGDETDGLMAEWSVGNQQGQVNPGLL
jgi:hypothetical protein